MCMTSIIYAHNEYAWCTDGLSMLNVVDCYQLIESLLVLLFQPLVQFRVQNLKQGIVNTLKQEENNLNPPHPNALSQKGSQAQIP